MTESANGGVTASQSDTGTGASQADVAAAVRAAASAAQTAASQAAASGTLAQEQTVSDVGQGEAYILNMKRLVAEELNVDAQLHQVNVGSAQRLAILAETALANAVALANRVNNQAITDDVRANDNAGTMDKMADANTISERERTVRGGDAGDVIRWGVLAKNPVEQDAIIAGMVAAVDRYLAKKPTA